MESHFSLTDRIIFINFVIFVFMFTFQVLYKKAKRKSQVKQKWGRETDTEGMLSEKTGQEIFKAQLCRLTRFVSFRRALNKYLN